MRGTEEDEATKATKATEEEVAREKEERPIGVQGRARERERERERVESDRITRETRAPERKTETESETPWTPRKRG